MQDDSDDAGSSDDKEDAPSTSAGRRSAHFASSLFNGTFGKRVRIAASENSDKSGKVQPAPKRRGRKATGAVTKEQLFAVSQQEESDGDEGDDGPSNLSARQRG